ncbi:hypothetical protein O999_10955 [Pseudomonas putida LF54]|nr:hypothetical protein O999_10955 [Pseudomonas putida LF54]
MRLLAREKKLLDKIDADLKRVGLQIHERSRKQRRPVLQ